MNETVNVDSLDDKQAAAPDQSEKPDHVDDNDKTPAEIIALRRRIKEEADKRRELEMKLKAEEEKKLQEKEEFKTLYEKAKAEIDVYKVKAEQLDEYENMEKERILNLIPEEKRERYANLGLQALKLVEEDFLNKQKPNPPNVDNSAPADGGGGFTSLLEAAEAFKRGEIKGEVYAKARRFFANRKN